MERGLFESRAKAQAAIMAGKVKVAGHERPKAGTQVIGGLEIEVLEDAVPFVSRGGLKLRAGLDEFGIKVSGRTAVDVGASTGGFTDCLLQRGAVRVYAVDVGHGQLDAKLRADSRVVNLEKTHARDLKPELFDEAPDLAVVDVSFIALAKVLPHIVPCLKKPFEIVALVKPQFELEPKMAPKGVVRDEAFRQEAVSRARKAASKLGLTDKGLLESPVKGPKGNVEFLIYLTSRQDKSS